jgi:hypothetical protein
MLAVSILYVFCIITVFCIMQDASHPSRRFSKRHLPSFLKNSKRSKSPGVESSFSASRILPEVERDSMPIVTSVFDPPPQLPHMPPTRAASTSPGPASVFDMVGDEVQVNYGTEPTTAPTSGSADQDEHYDLKAPPPSVPPSNMESLSQRFFSVDHLNIILRDHQLYQRFYRFLAQYKPYTLPSLECYIDTQKAVAAVEYANSLADNLPVSMGHDSRPRPAATMDEDFQQRATSVVRQLVEDALPAYITHRLVQIVTDTLVKEITGNNSPVMRDMIPALAEVYCIADPSLPDNPIVYASEGWSLS